MAITTLLAAINQEKTIIAKQTSDDVAATSGYKILNTLKFVHKDESKFSQFRRAGSRGTAVSRKDTAHTTFQLSGTPDYNELGYIFSMNYGIPTSSVVSGGTNAHQHVWTVKADQPNPVALYTAFWGTGAYIRRAIGMQGDAINIKGDRNGKIEVGGSGFARETENTDRDIFTYPAVGSISQIDMAPMVGVDVALKFYEQGAVNPPILKDMLTFEQAYASIAAPVFTFNRSTTYEGAVEQEEPKGTAKITVPVKSTYLASLELLENGTPLVLEFDAVGSVIEGTTHYGWNHQCLVYLEKKAEDTKTQNVLAKAIPLLLADDGSEDIMTITLVNTVASY